MKNLALPERSKFKSSLLITSISRQLGNPVSLDRKLAPILPRRGLGEKKKTPYLVSRVCVHPYYIRACACILSDNVTNPRRTTREKKGKKVAIIYD